MPRGVVLFQNHNSAVSAWTWIVDGQARGELQPGRGRRTVAAVGPPAGLLHTVRTVRPYDGTPHELGLDRALSRSRENRAWLEREGRWERVGTVVQHLSRLPSGAVASSRDSTSMFRQVAEALGQSYETVQVPFVDTLADADEEHGSEAVTATGVLDALRGVAGTGYDFFAYSGHGAEDGLASAGIRQGPPPGGRIGRFAEQIKRLVAPGGTVILYACLTGHDGGFAQELSRLLPTLTIWGHNTPGRASRNPLKVRCRAGVREPIGALIGDARLAAWRQRLHDTDLYLRFPFMTIEALCAELDGG